MHAVGPAWPRPPLTRDAQLMNNAEEIGKEAVLESHRAQRPTAPEAANQSAFRNFGSTVWGWVAVVLLLAVLLGLAGFIADWF